MRGASMPPGPPSARDLKPGWPVVVYTGERLHPMTSLWNVEEYWLTRTVFQRGLGLIYLIAFLNAVNEFKPLLGGRGLLPVQEWIQRATFRESPSIFFLAATDGAFTLAAWAGVALSCLVLSGLSERGATWISALVWALLIPAIPLIRQRWADLLRIRLGVDSSRGGVLRDLPGRVALPTAVHRDTPAALALLSRHVRRGLDQIAGGSVLARYDVPQLPLQHSPCRIRLAGFSIGDPPGPIRRAYGLITSPNLLPRSATFYRNRSHRQLRL